MGFYYVTISQKILQRLPEISGIRKERRRHLHSIPISISFPINMQVGRWYLASIGICMRGSPYIKPDQRDQLPCPVLIGHLPEFNSSSADIQEKPLLPAPRNKRQVDVLPLCREERLINAENLVANKPSLL